MPHLTHHAPLTAATVGFTALLCALTATVAEGTPLYTARAGRACDNCHSLPNAWSDPAEFWKRKCTLSCVSFSPMRARTTGPKV